MDNILKIGSEGFWDRNGYTTKGNIDLQEMDK
jgi:hypothetical protein